jgi:hypothetical protein
MKEDLELAPRVTQREKVRRGDEAEPAAFSHGCRSVAGRVFELQRIIGNQAVRRLFESGVVPTHFNISHTKDGLGQRVDGLLHGSDPAAQLKDGRPSNGAWHGERVDKNAVLKPKAVSQSSTGGPQRRSVAENKDGLQQAQTALAPITVQTEKPLVIKEPGSGNYVKASQNETSSSTGLFDAIGKFLNPPPQLKGIASAPTPGNCGEMRWETRWELSEYGRGGFVIQEVHWREHLQRYCDRQWTEDSEKTYSEAWWVVKNGKTPSNDDAVPDTMGRKIPHEANRGSIEIDATAQYYDDVAEAELPADMVRFNPDTNAGSLRSSLNKPILDGKASKPIPHYIKFEWDCCDDRNNRINNPSQVVRRIP